MAKRKQKENKIQIFVTSDLWLGRHNAIDIFNRPFKSVNDMNNTIVERWNMTVGEDDIVFILGNMVYDGIRAQNLVSELRGFKILLATENDKRTFEVDPKLIEELATGTDNRLPKPMRKCRLTTNEIISLLIALFLILLGIISRLFK